ncbi:MAG TPA: hypothetical protein VI072_04840 [Polyangiaceae bacterium]
MPISGLLITFEGDESLRSRALGTLAHDARIMLGELVAGTLPVVTDTRDPAEAETLVRDLQEIEGVAGVDVVCIDLSLDSEG